jgi:hypothetical protein
MRRFHICDGTGNVGFNDKVDQVLAHLKIVPDWNKRPYSSIKSMKDFRNSVAHGKPVEIEYDQTVPADELDRRIDLSGEWQKACSAEAVDAGFADTGEAFCIRHDDARRGRDHRDRKNRGGITCRLSLPEIVHNMRGRGLR